MNVLILTDHSGHSAENSVYALASSTSKHPRVSKLCIASRGLTANEAFFSGKPDASLWGTEVQEGFEFQQEGNGFRQNLEQLSVADFAMVWLRLPPPLSPVFLDHVAKVFYGATIINNPAGIVKTGSKAFLTNFEHLCPPMRLCYSLAAIETAKQQFPVVLKPLTAYGGKGIVRIDGDTVWQGDRKTTYTAFKKALAGTSIEYLAVKYLPQVSAGDKRIIVVDGKVLGASLRLPAAGSWMCNVAQGGTSHLSDITEAEEELIAAINPQLTSLGIVMYGVDTLMGDDGYRLLSELNTTSIGGLPQIAKQRNLPLVDEAVDRILAWVIRKKKNE